MHDWNEQIRAHLKSLRIDPGREADIVDEISQHMDLRYEELRALGVTEDEAQRVLVEELREPDALSMQMSRLRQAHSPPPITPGTAQTRILDGLWRDLRIAVRTLLRTPVFTAAAALTLALAIGANTAIFSVVDAVLLDPLAFPEADRLVSIRASAPGSDLSGEVDVSAEFYFEYRENATTLEDLGYYDVTQSSMRAEGNVERLFMAWVSPSLYSTLRVKPLIGRLPTEDDESGSVVVISHWLWTTWFGADPSVIGRAFAISGNQKTVIGVMGPEFRFPQEQTAVWMHSRVAEPVRPGNFGFLSLVGRLRPGADNESLTTELAALAQRLPERVGGSSDYARIIEHHRPVVRSLEESLVGDVKRPLWILLGTVGIVLVIACANVANLLVVRAASRRRESAVRRALGAARGAMIRSQMAEALVLAVSGGVAGTLLAWVAVPLIVRAAPENVPRIGAAGIDATALLFCAGVTILAALLSGLLPAIRFSSFSIAEGLRDSRTGPSPDHHLMRDALVVLQTGAALVLLVGSGLLFQSFQELNGVDPGFDTADIFTFQIAPDFRATGLTDPPTLARFHYEFMDRLSGLPGVQSVGLVDTLPLDEGARMQRFATERTDAAGGGAAEPLLRTTPAGGDYFQTMGIELLRGERFPRNTEPSADLPAIVSRSAGEILWPGEDPLGKKLRQSGTPETEGWLTVTGVVEDVMLNDFRQQAPDPIVYLPLVGPNWIAGTPAYVVKSPRADAIAPEIRELIREFAPTAPMYRVFTMERLAARTMAELSLTMLTLAIAAGLAVILGAVGIYGTLSYMVSQRTKEIGIRMALGAGAGQVRRMIVTHVGRVVAIGVTAGVVAALALTRLLDSLLFRVSAGDAMTFIVMSAVVIGIALIASYVPARRASSVDPLISLRAE
jgi:predicted permease